MKKKFYTYGYLSPAPDNILYYIGKGKDNRAYDKRHTAPVPEDRDLIIFFNEDLTTYHKEPQYFTEEKAFDLEIKCIAKYGRMDLNEGYLLNSTDGGEGASGRKHSEETKKKMSLAKMGNLVRTGMTHSEETKKKMSAAQTRTYLLGKTLSEEARKKISAARTGMTHSEEARKKISAASMGNKNWMGKTHSEETRRKISETKLKNMPLITCIHCGNTGKGSAMYRWHNDNCKHKNAGKLPI